MWRRCQSRSCSLRSRAARATASRRMVRVVPPIRSASYPNGVARSDGGDWSWIAKADTIIDPNEGALWSVDHERRVIAFVYKDPITRFEA